MRVLLALGGNALTAQGRAGPEDQIAGARVATAGVAELVADGVDVVITHGNGPQVGNLLVKNEIAASVVPPVPLDWCVAQTQATLGFVLMNTLDAALRSRGVDRRTATVVTRVLVDLDDPGFANPSKPIGRYLSREDAALLIQHGETWQDRGERGWRRVVASPEPREILDAATVHTLVEAGFVVVANGGGGVPVVRSGDDSEEVRGVEAVIDKDLGAALLARTVHADVLVIATDVPNAVLRFGTPEAEPLGRVDVRGLRPPPAGAHCAGGPMGPRVEPPCRFVERGGARAVISTLDHILDAVAGETGTVVVPAG